MSKSPNDLQRVCSKSNDTGTVCFAAVIVIVIAVVVVVVVVIYVEYLYSLAPVIALVKHQPMSFMYIFYSFFYRWTAAENESLQRFAYDGAAYSPYHESIIV